MSNKDTSILPSKQVEEGFYYDHTTFLPGLTKKEYAAIHILAGMMANSELYKIVSKRLHPDEQAEFYNTSAIEQADELFKQLEDENTNTET